MAEMPFVSVIVPTRNRATSLDACIQALCLEDYAKDRYEIVVVDDASTDLTALAVQEWAIRQPLPQIRYLRSPAQGANAARNIGIRQTEGEFLCFVDDDVLPPRTWLRQLVTSIDTTEAELVWGPVLLSPGLKLPGRHRSELASYLSESLHPQVPLLCNMLARRAVFERGLFDPRWSAPVEEIEWLLRTDPSRAFAPAAWLYHNKRDQDCSASKILRLAWYRGIESGRFDRFRFGRGSGRLVHAAVGAMRSIGHSLATGCVGGLLVAAGRAGYMVGHGLAAPRDSRQAPVTPGIPYA